MKKVILFTLSFILIWGCSHTNELGKYEINGKKALFETKVKPQARTIQINRTTTTDSKESKEKKSALQKIAEVGTEIFSASKESDIKEWVNTRDVVEHISDGLQDALETYVKITAVESAKDDPDFIIEMNLETCNLNVRENSVSLNMYCTSKIIERGTGNIVWENWESVTEQLSSNYNNKKKTKTESKVLTAIQLASLSENEINGAVYDAAEEAGRKMADTFREDLSEAKKGN